MKCPMCRMNNERVCDSRKSKNGTSIWRRRICLSCGYKWTTREKYDYRTLEEAKNEKIQ